MSKELESYVKEHKKSFDTDEPSGELWSRIESELDKKKVKKTIKLPFWLGVAASLVVIVSIIFMSTYLNKHKELELADINPAYAKKELKFASLIEEKRDSLLTFAKDNPVLYQQFSADLNKLGADYEHLKKELQNSPNQQFVVKAMVKNLELQLQVISRQLLIINNVDEYKKENKI